MNSLSDRILNARLRTWIMLGLLLTGLGIFLPHAPRQTGAGTIPSVAAEVANAAPAMRAWPGETEIAWPPQPSFPVLDKHAELEDTVRAGTVSWLDLMDLTLSGSSGRVNPTANRPGIQAATPDVSAGWWPLPSANDSSTYRPAGANGRVTQEEVDTLENGLTQTLAAIENNLMQEVFGETYPLVGKNFQVAWSNNTAGFRYLTTLRTAVVAGLGTLTNAVDYSTAAVGSAINSRLTSAGFNAGSQVAVTTVNNFVQLAFTTLDTVATNVPISTNVGLPNLELDLLSAPDCRTALSISFNFTVGVDGSGFYLEHVAPFSFNTTSTISNVNTAVRFVRLPYTLTDVTSNRTSVPLNFVISLKDPNNNGRLRLNELGGSPDLLDATVTGDTRMSFALLASVPASALLPQVGTDLKVLWVLTAAPVNPADDNADCGNRPLVSLENNRVNLHSFFNSFAGRALDEIADTTESLQPLIDVLTTEVPLFSDLGSDAVTVLEVLGGDPDTVAAIGALGRLADLADLAGSYSGNANEFIDLGSYGLLAASDLRVDALTDIPLSLSRIPSSTQDPDLVDFLNAEAGIAGLSFPLLEDGTVIANMLLGRAGTLFTWNSGLAQWDEQFNQFFPVFGPVGVTLGGLIGLEMQFGFGYDTQGMFDFYDAGGNNPDLFLNGFYAVAADAQGLPVTGITLKAGITAGIEANVVASVGVEGDVTATIGMYLNDQLGVGDGKVRGYTLANTPFTDWFYAAGSLSAGLRAYLEIGWPPVGVEFEFESPRVVLINFDSRDNNVPVLAEPGQANPGELVLNVGDRAHRRLVGQTNDVAEEFVIAAGLQGILIGAFGEENTFTDSFTLIKANSEVRGDIIEVQADVNIPVLFTGGAGRDLLTGGAAADELNGGEGPDKLKGQGGPDILRGNEDNDELVGGLGADTLNGGSGNDTASWADSLTPITMDLRTGIFTGEAALDTLISIERYKGTPFNDVMDGSESHDQSLHGGGGEDLIRGHGGDDLLEGDPGNDTLLGGTGNDMINGGAGADTMDGGDGVDTLSYLAPTVAGLPQGVVGEPVTISLLTGLGTRGDANGDVFSNFEILIGSGVPQGVTAPAASGDDLTGSDNADTIHGMGGNDLIHGAGGDDVIYGDNNVIPGDYSGVSAPLLAGFDADMIYGDAGNDQLFGQTDKDKLSGGEGNDMLDGGEGEDDLDGGPGQDTLLGGEGNDHLFNFDLLSPDLLDGQAGINRLSADFSEHSFPFRFTVGTNNGFAFPDGDLFTNMHTLGTLTSGSGNDVIRLAASQEPALWNKTIHAGGGDDLVIADWRGFYPVPPPVDVVRTTDNVNGCDGNDTLSFEQSIGDVNVNLTTGGLTGAAEGMTMSGFENVIGSPLGDDLDGDAGPNILDPLPNPQWQEGYVIEYVRGAAGVDTLRADFSNVAEVNARGLSMTPNAISGYEPVAIGTQWDVVGSKVLVYYSGIERFEITGGAASDRLYGEGLGSGATNYNDRLLGLGGNDYLDARFGDDYLDGGAGNDTLEAGTGNDTVVGGPGNDVVIFDYSGGYGVDSFDGGADDDLVTNLRDPTPASVPVPNAEAGDVFRADGGPGYDTLNADFSNQTEPIHFHQANPADTEFSNGAYLRGFEFLKDFASGNGDDVFIFTGRENNRIQMHGGNDIINPGLGIDIVSGGTGDDLLIIDYSVGDDADASGITSTTADVHTRTSLSTGMVLDRVTVSLGGNSAYVMERSHITGTSKADNLRGRAGADTLLGGAGDDTLTGNNGSDWLDGGPGADLMNGNLDNDTFVVEDAGDVVAESSSQGTDTVRARLDYTLPVNVELLVLTGGALTGTSNSASNAITGNAWNNTLRGEGGNDLLNGGGSAGEIDLLNGGPGADTFVLGDAGVRFYDDGNPATPGHNGYAIIEDFTPSQSDRLRLAGNAGQYFLGVSPIGAVPGTAVYHDSNGNAALDPSGDELIAILVSGETLTTTNTLTNASYTPGVDPALIGLTAPLRALIANEGAAPRGAVEFSIFEPMPSGILLEIQSSSDMGVSDPWLTIASRNSSGPWSGVTTVTVSAVADGKVMVTVSDQLPLAQSQQRFFRARLSQP